MSKAAQSAAAVSRAAVLSLGPDPFPAVLRSQTVYAEPVSITSNALTAFRTGTASTWNLNSLYSPTSGGGHQPYGRDTLATLYRKYKVTRVRVEIELHPNLVVSYTSGMTGIFTPPSATYSLTGVDMAVFYEKPGAFTLTQGAMPRTFVYDFPMWQLSGVTKREFDTNNEEFAAAFGSNPTRIPTLQLVAWSNEAAADRVTCVLKITQWFECFERIILAQS